MTIEEKRSKIHIYCGDARDHNCVGNDGAPDCPLFKVEDPGCYSTDCTDEQIENHYNILFGENETPENAESNDEVNKAAHYNRGGIECIKAIEASMSPEEYQGFLKGQVLKYVWRYQHKGTPVKDLKKARYYLDELIRVTEGRKSNDRTD